MIAVRHYQDKKVGVFGLAKAGTATVSALISGGAYVYVWDDNEASRQTFSKQFMEGKIKLLPIEQWPWAELEIMALSPGVPLTHPVPHAVVQRAQAHNVMIAGDIELLCQAQPHAQKVAITGTNGKSTTTSLIGHILKTNMTKVEVGGNLGTPALSLAPVGSDGVYVLELSSYQLDLVHSTRFNVAMLLNITPDHLDRHGSMEGYVAAKHHIFERQTKVDAALVSIDDDYSRSVYAGLKQISKARIIPVSIQHELKQGIWVDKEGHLHDKMDERAMMVISLAGMTHLTGRHNWQNAAFAYAACRVMGMDARDIEQALQSFPGLRHRLQQVATIHGVRFINDSKATNADATSHALAPFSQIYWIAGGKAKEGGIASLTPYFPSITHAFLIGEAQDAFAHTLEGQVPYTKCGTLAQAFEQACRRAFDERKPGAVVLLSPACASFDQWKNFEARGDAFCELVEQQLNKVIRGKRQ